MASLVMGILNVTPDSFYDGGRYFDTRRAIVHGLEMVAEGADVVDVGGESTRPGAQSVPENVELARVIPVVEALAGTVRVSIDTSKPAVALAAVRAGATLVNDVSATLADVAAEVGAGYVVMHMQGTPADMQVAPHYGDVVADVSAFLAKKAAAAEELGMAEVWIDPGIGFGKTVDHNLALLAALPDLTALGWPVLIGTSRKSFLGKIAPVRLPLRTKIGRAADVAGAGDRLEASIATAVFALQAGASMVRVHDVAATVAARRILAEEVSV